MGEGVVSKKFRFGDAFAVLFVVILAFAVFILLPEKGAGDTVNITTQNGKYTYDISDERKIELSENGIEITVVISDGAVYVESSTCPDGICKLQGKLEKSGCIACLPAGVLIEVTSEGVDAVAG